jgi:putative endonuclease
MSVFSYILRSISTGAYYVGQTRDLEDRLRRHNQQRSKATKGRGPWELVFQIEFPTRSQAMAWERKVKSQKSCAFIERLIAGRDTHP